MKYYIFIIAIILLFSCNRKVVENTTAGYYNYEASVVEVGAQGTVIVKAWGTASNIREAKEEAKKNAVHALIFKGFANSVNINSTDLRPLVTEPNAEQKHRDYFSSFFSKNGKYTKFVQFTDGLGTIEAGDKIKTGKLYKVAVTVSITRQQLIKELEGAGIKKSFGIH